MLSKHQKAADEGAELRAKRVRPRRDDRERQRRECGQGGQGRGGRAKAAQSGPKPRRPLVRCVPGSGARATDGCFFYWGMAAEPKEREDYHVRAKNGQQGNIPLCILTGAVCLRGGTNRREALQRTRLQRRKNSHDDYSG